MKPNSQKRGRKPKPLALTPDAAILAQKNGGLPYRPRTDAERLVMSKPMGRPRLYSNSPTYQAALLAQYLVTQNGLTIKGAARLAAEQYGLNPETIRKHTRKLLNGPTVELQQAQQVMGVWLTNRKNVKLLHSVEDVQS